MALKQTVITRVEPDAPGWYWYRPDGETSGWRPIGTFLGPGPDGHDALQAQIIETCAGRDHLRITEGEMILVNNQFLSHRAMLVSDMAGEWGDEIPLPKAAHKSQTTTQILPKEGTRTGSHRRAPIKAPAESMIQPEQLAKFLYWISERHNIYLRRHWPWPVGVSNPSTDFDQTSKKFKNTSGLMTNLAGGQYSTTNQKPWTTDPVLQSNFFCNPFRELDKTTQWFRDNVREPLRDSPDIIMATIIFRWFNYIPTGEALLSCASRAEQRTRAGNGPLRPKSKSSKVEHPGLGLFTNWDSAQALAVLKPMKKVFTGAHVVASGTQLADTGPRDGGGSPKVRSILDLIDRLWSKRMEISEHLLSVPGRSQTTLHAAHLYLQSFPAIGDFQAYEIVTDLRHTYILENAPDILTWANAGPGAKRGLNRIFGRPIQFASPSHPWQKEMQCLLSACNAYLFHSSLKGVPKGQDMPADQQAMIPDFSRAAINTDLFNPIPKGHPSFELREVEHSLCEFDKYLRLREPNPDDGGPQNAKRKYAGT